MVAKVFMENMYKLHGLPAFITSDRDPVFLSQFWKELFSIQGVNLHYSTAYHPQTDGQTEIVNKGSELLKMHDEGYSKSVGKVATSS